MGTRNLTVVQLGGEYKVAQYGQWDGYPEGQGATILKFLLANKLGWANKIAKCSFLTKEEIAVVNADPNWSSNYPYLSRDIAGEILSWIEQSEDGLKLVNQIDFAKDGLSCEYVYVIDIDKRTFEAYKGFGKGPMPEGERFYSDTPDEYGYYPVRLWHSWSLDELPTVKEFLAELDESEEEEEAA